MDGETFESQWTDRAWTETYEEMVQCSDSVMLFIHPRKVVEGALIRDAMPLIAAITEPSAAEATSPTQSPPPQPEPSVDPAAPAQRGTPTQVQIVELLQFVRRAKGESRKIQLGVIISAWDVVMKQGSTTPDDWLRKNMPLLYQYLASNREMVGSRVYGVSAQGGDITKDVAYLRKKHKPSDRIIVFEGKTKTSDISIPIRWLMGATKE